MSEKQENMLSRSTRLLPLLLLFLLLGTLPAQVFSQTIDYQGKAILVIDVEQVSDDADLWINEILSILWRNNASCVFFFTGKYAEAFPTHVRRVYASGHDIGLHSYSHLTLTKLDYQEQYQEIQKNSKIIEDIIKITPNIFRAPFRETDYNTMKVLKELDIKIDVSAHLPYQPPQIEDSVIRFSQAVDDWVAYYDNFWSNEQFIGEVKNQYFKVQSFHAPLIVGFHPQIIGEKLSVLEEIIVNLKSEGATFSTLTELTGFDPAKISGGFTFPFGLEFFFTGLFSGIFLTVALILLIKKRNAKNKGLIFLFSLSLFAIFIYKYHFDQWDTLSILLGYNLILTGYIFSRFGLAFFYKPPPSNGSRPTVSVIIPAKNEEKVIAKTVQHHLDSNYPKEKLEIILINDGSTDNTWTEICKIKAKLINPHPRFKAINWKVNRGKRRALAQGIRCAQGEIVVVNDSDSFVAPNALIKIVQPFTDSRVAGVVGHTDVHNTNSVLGKIQSVRYYVAFKVRKAAEAIFKSVICLSGCFAAYRRKYLLEILDEWENQQFLGVKCSYGDDRSLTTLLLRKGYSTLFVPEAKASTMVPETFRKLWKQQLRWKKSWIRESYLASKFMWRRSPFMALSFYANMFLTILSPFMAAYILIYSPLFRSILPATYIAGLCLVALLYAIYYRIENRNNLWMYSFLWGLFYVSVLVWQIFYAFINLRDNRWGTR